MSKCEMNNCRKEVFVVAFPDKIPVRLCRDHFITKMGHLIDPYAPTINTTVKKKNKES